MATNTFYIGDNQIALKSLVDAGGNSITSATVAASVFQAQPLHLSSQPAAVQEVQQLIPDFIATGGTFKLGYHGNWTSAINYNETLANIQADLQALTGIGSGNVVVSGNQLSATNFAQGMTFTFAQNFGQAFLVNFDFSGITGPTQNGTTLKETVMGLARGCAYNLGSGYVSIPIQGISDVYTGGFIKIAGSRNYDGEYAYDPTQSTKGRIAIQATFAYEEFDGSELVYIGLPNGKDITMTADGNGNYYGDIPANLACVVEADTIQVHITASSGGLIQQFRVKAPAKFYGD